MSNLNLYVKSNRGYFINKDDIYDDNQIRKMLLEQGLAKIIDENIATKKEISYQKNAIKNEVGIWEIAEKNKSFITLHSIYNKLKSFI